jgi:N-acetylglucosamine malate deacetylase 1
MATVLVCAAHPDDEALGCGGTLLKHVAGGDHVHILFVADGVASRHAPDADVTADAARRRSYAHDAARRLGARAPTFLDFPDQRLDQVALLDICQAIERATADIQPDIVYTHHAGDLNCDHQIVNRAVLTAFRPTPGRTVRAIYGFEVASSSEWAFGLPSPFCPNRFVSMTDFLAGKLDVLRCYDVEMRAPPHPRSYQAVAALAAVRGATVGVAAAEAFTVLREIDV